MYNFLIVDDEILIRKGTLKKIDKLNLPITCVAEATNGKEAMEQLAANPIDFVITDMDMPEVDGIGLLEHLKKDYPTLPIIVISGYQNFDYVKKALEANAVNYILKPFSKEDILKSINEVTAKLAAQSAQKISEEEMIVNAALGHKTESAIKALSKRIGPSTGYHLIVLSVFNEEKFEQQSLNDIVTFITPIPYSERSIVLGMIEKNKLPLLIECTKESCLCGISKEVTDLLKIHDNYQQAIDALNSRSRLSLNSVTYVDDSFKKKNYSFEKSLEIMYLIEAGKAVLLKEKLTDYFDSLLDTKEPTLYSLKKLGLSMIEQSKNLLDDFYHTTSNYTFPEISKEIMEQIFDFSEVTSYFIEFLSTISAAMSYEKIYDSDDIISNVKTYLQNHFKEPINLDLLADIFYLNHSYLSVLFKERTGVKYIDYLNKLRIEEAKTLLCTTDKKAKFIAKAVGYENEKYFFRVFKKYTQETPEQYRVAHKVDKNNNHV